MNATRLILALGFTALGACTIYGPPPTSAPQPRGDGAASEPAADGDAAAPAASAAATASLIAVGRSARQSGDYEGATAYIEQALRIAPNDPVLWLELGEVKLAEGDTAQAEAMGRRALALSGGDRTLEAAARRLIDAN